MILCVLWYVIWRIHWVHGDCAACYNVRVRYINWPSLSLALVFDVSCPSFFLGRSPSFLYVFFRQVSRVMGQWNSRKNEVKNEEGKKKGRQKFGKRRQTFWKELRNTSKHSKQTNKQKKTNKYVNPKAPPLFPTPAKVLISRCLSGWCPCFVFNLFSTRPRTTV